MKRISAFLIALTLSLSMAVAQERKPFLVRAVNKLGAFIDTMATRGIDKRAAGAEKPYQQYGHESRVDRHRGRSGQLRR